MGDQTKRCGSRGSKEVDAVKHNLKESEILKKAIQSLELEKTYAAHLHNLDQRQVHLSRLRLHRRVSKIRSHLDQSEISEFRLLDRKGKLGSGLSSIRVKSAAGISATTKRLGLQSAISSGKTPETGHGTPCDDVQNAGRRQRNQQWRRHSLPTVTVYDSSSNVDRATSANHVPTSTVTADRAGSGRSSSSTSGSASSADSSESETPSTPVITIIHGLTKERLIPSEDGKGVGSSVKNSCNGLTRSTASSGNKALQRHTHSSTWRNRSRVTDRAAKPHIPGAVRRVNYSSHRSNPEDAFPDEAQGANAYGFLSSPDRSCHEAVAVAEQRRAAMLEHMAVAGDDLEKRRKSFLARTADWIHSNPGFVSKSRDVVDILAALTRMEPAERSVEPGNKSRHRSMFIQHLGRHTALTKGKVSEMSREEEYQLHMNQAWRDINKCRYLRIPEDRIDLSGVNTLAADQYRLYQVLKLRALSVSDSDSAGDTAQPVTELSADVVTDPST